MYDDLVKRLRRYVEIERSEHHGAELEAEAADAIEDLQQTVDHMKAIVIDEAQHTEMFDERDKKTLIEMAKSLPLQIVPVKDEKPRWVSVTERLPEDRSDVLAYLKYEVGGRIAAANYDKGMWQDCVMGGLYRTEEGVITHWMPIPQPPKEKNND